MFIADQNSYGEYSNAFSAACLDAWCDSYCFTCMWDFGRTYCMM